MSSYSETGRYLVNKTPVSPGEPRDIACILEKPLANCPGREALADRNRRYTYGELDSAVAAAMRTLINLGVGSGDRVGCSAPNGCDLVIAFLATQRLGAIWVGLNRILPASEKIYLLNHSQTSVVLGDADVTRELKATRNSLKTVEHFLELDAEGKWLSMPGHEIRQDHNIAINPHAPAAICYTSGTTGKPKGIIHSQASLLAPIKVATALDLWGASCRRGVILPLTITNVVVLGPLLTFLNHSCCVCTSNHRSEQILPWIEEEAIEVMSTVPTIVYDLKKTKKTLPSLKVLLCGGAPLPAAVRADFRDRYGFEITNTYGLTEAPTIVADTRGLDGPTGTSGKVLPHIRLSFRDTDGQETHPGQPGEICLQPVRDGRWANVFCGPLGYWRDERLTAERSSLPWFATGDIGYVDQEGWLYIIDRKADLIIRGGSNIYPQEIVEILNTDSRIEDCAVVGVPDERMGERITAFIKKADPTADTDELIASLVATCKDRLASYKCPEYWFELDAIPRNPGGKVILPDLRRRAAELVKETPLQP